MKEILKDCCCYVCPNYPYSIEGKQQCYKECEIYKKSLYEEKGGEK